MPADFPAASLVTPRPVTLRAADGVLVHGQLFEPADGLAHAKARRPALVFLHGGPPRQMLLGWHYMDYYSRLKNGGCRRPAGKTISPVPV